MSFDALNTIELPTSSSELLNTVLKLDNQLCFPLWAAAKAVVHRYTPFLDELGLTYTQYITLMALWEQDGMSVKQLGERLYLDSGTITPLLKKLEAKGFVERKRSAADERSTEVFLTKNGRALKEKAGIIPLQMANCIQLNPQEALQLQALLYKVMKGITVSEDKLD